MKRSDSSSRRAMGRVKRKPVSVHPEDMVSISPLYEGQSYPTLVKPKLAGLKLAEWGTQCRDLLDRLLWEKRSLLFRGFDLGGIEGFESFVLGTSNGKPLPYRDRTTPREVFGENIYNTTVFPREERMAQHNEGSYWAAWSLKAFFACITAPSTGGATPMADTHAIYERLSPALREEFERRQWVFVRNYNEGFGLPWQEVFQCNQRSEVEAFCAANLIECEWLGSEGLRTRQVRRAVRKHPKSGEKLWFNHVAFYNIASRPESMRSVLLDEFGERGLPFNTFYGDGDPISAEVIEEINAAYDAEEVFFPWQEGDLHLIDNMRLTHGRQPYTGERLILVALTEVYAGEADE